MNLGICYIQPFWEGGDGLTTTDTSIVLPLYVGRDYFDEVHLFVPFEAGDSGPLPLSLGEPDSLVPGLDRDRIVVHPLPMRTHAREWYAAGAVPDLLAAARTIRRGLDDCDLVWLPGPVHPPTLLCYALCRLRGVPAFLYLRSDQRDEIAVQEFDGLLSVKQALGRHVLPRIESYLVRQIPTVAAGPGIAERHADRTDRLHVVRSVHLSERQVCPDPDARIADNEGRRVLYVGRLVPVKGVDDLIDAVGSLAAAGRDVALDVVGTGKSEADLRARAAESPAADAVTFHGFVPFGPDLFDRYREADAFVLPSHSEGFPNVVLEAMAHGVPVVATRVGGIDEVVTDGETALLVPPGDSEALADAVGRLQDDPGLRARLVRNGVELAREYTVERQREEVMDVLETEFPALF
ncbi:MAG: glycosyltransferase family 4 protein [Haloarculaceae archaeon]